MKALIEPVHTDSYSIFNTKNDDYSMSFKIFEVIGLELPGEVPVYGCEYEYSRDPEASDFIIEGTIKWDSCSDWDFTNNNVWLHFCDKGSVNWISESIKKCYELTEQHLETYIDYESPNRP